MASYGGFYQTLNSWRDVYTEYVRRESLERDTATQYLRDLEILRLQPMDTKVEVVAWTRSDFNIDIVVGGIDRKFYLLHNVQAFFSNGHFHIAGMTGPNLESPFLQLGGLQNLSTGRTGLNWDSRSEDSRMADIAEKVYNDLQRFHRPRYGQRMTGEEYVNDGEPATLFIICPIFMTRFILENTIPDAGFNTATLAWAVRRAAKENFPEVFSDELTSNISRQVTACQHFLFTFEEFIRNATKLPHRIFIREVYQVTRRQSNLLRQVLECRIKYKENIAQSQVSDGKGDRALATMTFWNAIWGPSRGRRDIERQHHEEEQDLAPVQDGLNRML
jgi:hypothetical protein